MIKYSLTLEHPAAGLSIDKQVDFYSDRCEYFSEQSGWLDEMCDNLSYEFSKSEISELKELGLEGLLQINPLMKNMAKMRDTFYNLSEEYSELYHNLKRENRDQILEQRKIAEKTKKVAETRALINKLKKATSDEQMVDILASRGLI